MDLQIIMTSITHGCGFGVFATTQIDSACGFCCVGHGLETCALVGAITVRLSVTLAAGTPVVSLTGLYLDAIRGLLCNVRGIAHSKSPLISGKASILVINAIGILANALGFIHGDVGLVDDVVNFSRGSREQGNTNTCCNGKLEFAYQEGLAA